MLIELDKQIMILLNRSISNSVFDFLMPLITNNKFLGFVGILLIAQMSSKNNLIDCNYTQKVISMAKKHRDKVLGFITQEISLNGQTNLSII